MKIGVAEEGLRFEHVEKSDVKLDDEAMIEKLCDFATDAPDEFLVLKKVGGGLLAVPGRAIRSIETDGLKHA